MGAIASQITSLASVDSAVWLGADQRKHQSSASLAFVRGICASRWKFSLLDFNKTSRSKQNFANINTAPLSLYELYFFGEASKYRRKNITNISKMIRHSIPISLVERVPLRNWCGRTYYSGLRTAYTNYFLNKFHTRRFPRDTFLLVGVNTKTQRQYKKL